MRADSMWWQSLAAFFWGLVLSISLMLNIRHLLPVAADTGLLVGVLVGFTLWGLVMVYCYAKGHVGRASIGCLKLLLVSATVNAVMVWL